MVSNPTNYASILERGFAYLIDGVILLVGILVSAAVLFPIVGEGLTQLFGLVVLAAYHVYSEAIWGRTPGKMIVGIRVVQTNGAACGWGGSTLRNLTKLLGGTLIATLVAIILIAVTDENQRLGDLIANTTVVRD